jgi:hypothetical protein
LPIRRGPGYLWARAAVALVTAGLKSLRGCFVDVVDVVHHDAHHHRRDPDRHHHKRRQ